MKKLILSSLLLSSTISFTQIFNEFPTTGTNANPYAYVGIGTKQGQNIVPQFNLHLYSWRDWSGIPIKDNPTDPTLPSVNYGKTTRFGMNNVSLGKGADKGVEFRLSEKNFFLTNQEHGGNIEINATGAKMIFQSDLNQINVGKVYTMYNNLYPTGQFNVFGGDKPGMTMLLTNDDAKFGLNIQATPKVFALSLINNDDGKQNFYALTSGQTYMKQLYVEPRSSNVTERVISTGLDFQNNPSFYVQGDGRAFSKSIGISSFSTTDKAISAGLNLSNPAFYVQGDGEVFSKTLKFTNPTNYTEKAILIPGDYGYDVFSVDRSGNINAGKSIFRAFENTNALEVHSVYYDEFDRLNFKVTGEGQVFARKYTTTLASFPDYVFDETYKLLPFQELKTYIEKNKHLPNIPSAKEIEANNGEVDLGELNRLLLEKVEEMTLYILQMEERLKVVEQK